VRGLYPIVDADALKASGIALLEFVDQLLAARPSLLQLRAKHWGARETLATLRALLPRCRAAGTLLFANDRPDLALLAGCDGVHVGQDDLPLALVRRIAPMLKIGVSTHDFEQLEAALLERPDYVAFGPIFATGSKQNPDPVVGLEGLARAATLARGAGVTLVAIGGITLERAPGVAQAGALAAVIAALIPKAGELAEVSGRARAFQRALNLA
jgi:thiamine-phosphate pyrophosphorylase